MAIGSDIVAKAMKHEGVTDFFYIMGAPMLGVEKACMTLGLRGIDVGHEQAAAMAGFAYSRLLNLTSAVLRHAKIEKAGVFCLN
jgi:thiamine pyrophosphate-dependent acetolactate synthase large subunit-like protein